MISFLPDFINKALIFLLAFLVFFLPFFFLPFASEYFGLNKLGLLAGLAAIGYFLLGVQKLLAQKLVFVRTKLDLAIFLILVIFLASAVFSVSPAVSFLGQPGVLHGGVFSLVLCLALYFLIVQVINGGGKTDKPRRLLIIRYSLLVSVLLLSLLALLQYFEVYVFPWEFSHQRFWTPIGGTRALVVYLLVAAPLAIGQLLRAKGIKKLFPALVLLVSLGAVFLVSGKGGPARNFLPEKYQSLPSEVVLDWQTSWQIANSVLGTKPLLGSGPGTFSSAFTRFKPQAFNQTFYFNVRFDRSANEWLEIISTLGLAGVIVYLYFWAKLVKFLVGERNRSPIVDQRSAVAFSLLIFLISTLFNPTTAATFGLFWILLGLFVAEAGLAEKVLVKAEGVVAGPKGKKTIQEIPLFKIFAGCLLFTAACFGYFYFFRLYRAEIDYRRATSEFSTNREKAFRLALSATQLNPLNDVYQIGLATASLGIASPLSQQASPSASLVQQFVNRAIVAGNRAVELNPESVRNWESLAGLYQNLLRLDPAAEQQVLNSFNQAVNWDPVNPVLRTRIAAFLFQRGRAGEAANQLLAAIRLKPDYNQAHYDLAQVYKATGDLVRARGELETVLMLVPQGGSQYETVELELQNLVSEEATPSGEAESGI